MLDGVSRRFWAGMFIGDAILVGWASSFRSVDFVVLYLLLFGFVALAGGAYWAIGIPQREPEVALSRQGITSGPDMAREYERQRLKNVDADFQSGLVMAANGLVLVAVGLFLGFLLG